LPGPKNFLGGGKNQMEMASLILFIGTVYVIANILGLFNDLHERRRKIKAVRERWEK
jgi:hypothetical protein